MSGPGIPPIVAHDDIEKQVIPCGVSQAAPLFPIANGSVIMPFQVDPNGSLFVNQQGTIPADGITPGTLPIDATSYMMVWNGISWDRVKSIPDNANGQAALVSGLPGVVARLQGYDPLLGNWNRVQVSNDNTDAQIPSATGHVAAIAHNMVFNGSTWDRVRAANKYNTVQATSGVTGIWSPAAGKKFRLMRVRMHLTENAGAVAAANLFAILLDGATGIGIFPEFYVPVAGSIVSHDVFDFDLGNGYLSTTVNNTLNVNMTTSLTTGVLSITVSGTEE